MKVKKEAVQNALYKFVDRICESMPSSTYKFLIGGGAGLIQAAGSGRLDETLKPVTDSEGLVDTEAIKTIANSAFKASGGKVQIQLFDKPGSLLGLLVKPVTVTITQEDFEKLMKDVETV